jgi:regulator of replication initiation timing
MKFDVETELIYNKTYDSMESMRKIVITLLGRIIETIREQIKEKEANTQLKLEVTSLKSSVEEREQQLQSATFQYTQNL